jgi:hypothetical protein
MLRAMSRRRALSFAFAAVGLTSLAGARAHAGITIVTQRGPSQTATLYIEGNRMRIDGIDKTGKGSSMIVDGANKKMIVVEEKEKAYVEMTEEDMKRMRAQVDAMRTQMQERMKNMPPEQRKKMEAMMANMGGPDGKPRKPPVLKFEKAGGKKTINGFSCDMYKVSKDGQLSEEDCIAPWSAAVVQKSDLAALKKFGEDMMKNFGMGAGNEMALDQLEKYPGIPISRVSLEAGGARGEEEQIKSIKRGGIEASHFAVPAGYKKKDLPPSMMGGGPPKGNLHPLPPPGATP